MVIYDMELEIELKIDIIFVDNTINALMLYTFVDSKKYDGTIKIRYFWKLLK